ncbi:hypothetical protein ACHAXM_006776 [Skeletonema potamos]
MTPFQSRRFDPYGDLTTSVGDNNININSNNNNNPHGTTRQRNLISSRSGTFNNNTTSRGHSESPPTVSTAPRSSHGGSSGSLTNTVTQPQQRRGRGSIHDRILESRDNNNHHGSRAEGGHRSNSYVGGGHNHRDAPVVWGNAGAAPLTDQVHPLLGLRRRISNSEENPFVSGGGRVDPYDLDDDKKMRRGRHQPSAVASASSMFSQTRRILSLLLGQVPEEDFYLLQKQHQTGFSGSTEEEIFLKLLSAKSTVRILRLFLFLSLLFYGSRKTLPSFVDRITRPKKWWWSAGVPLPGLDVAARRNLAGRNCVMNYFIEKQPPDEYDPDFVEIKPGEKNKDGTPKVRQPVKIVEGTYRTKGQVHVISRFIEAVADSFRSNTSIRQHIIFTESRDSGHLAFQAIRHWPPRGKHRTIVHVIASDELPHDKDSRNAAKALGYGALEDIEERFKGIDKARIYDRDGNLAGLAKIDEDMDDDEIQEAVEVDVPDKETLDLRMRSGKNRRLGNTTTLLPDGSRPYPNLRALLPFEEEDEGDGDIVVPYLHIDGTSMKNQLLVLESARDLLEDKTIVVVGIEHSPDLDVKTLISFFQSVRYKTFFLGARQIARIDNLCDEVLDDVLDHPSVKVPTKNWARRLFMHLGLISKDELRISGTKDTPEGPKRREAPPFFVAMPRGRRSKEEMTIQHMYDLFGGYGGGGGQIKTANDRKAPGK